MTTNRERAEELRERIDAITSRLGLAFDRKERATTAIWEALCAAEARGFEAGRAAERRDVVKHMRVAPRGRGVLIHINSSQDIARLADDIESAAHLPAKETP